jgi:hypothetical protein
MRSLIILLTGVTLFSCSGVKNLQYVPSNLETIAAIKEVLNGSTSKALLNLANAQNQGIEALLPDEVKPIMNTLKTLGLGDEIKKIDAAVVNVSAVALAESKGLMQDAIKEVQFADAASIILGGENAATNALKTTMYSAVKKRYSEKIGIELNKIPEVKYWDTAVSTYNMFAKNKINGTLEDFVAERSVDAIFVAMGNEEAVIRKNPGSLGKEMVTKVFDYYSKQK